MKTISGIKTKLQTLAFSTKTYQNWLSREEAEILQLVPVDIWPGQAQLGQACLTDDFGLGPESGLGLGTAEPMLFELHRQGVPARKSKTEGIDPRFHDGAWLRDLRALGGDEARRRARALIGAWLDRYANWEPEAWALPTLGARIANWLALHDFVLASADDRFRARVFASLASQTRHLSLALPGALVGYELVRAVKGLIYGGLCLEGLESYGEKGISLLLAKLDTLLARDGLVRERAPSVQLAMLRDLVDIRSLLRQDGIEVPPQLSAKIDAMAPALRCVRYGDGGLALFHGGDEGQGVVIEALLQQTGTRARAKTSLPDSGFERVTAGRACLLVDAALPPEPGYDKTAHAALGSFEFSIGRERLLVNCGTRSDASPCVQSGIQSGMGHAWRQALAASAAHNTAIVRDTNMIEVRASGLGPRPTLFAAERSEQLIGGLKNTRVTIEHNAYAPDFGVVCRRQLDLQADGQVLAGYDELRGAIGLTFAIRFHLHPGVQVSLIQDSRAALLKLPSGQGWRFRAPVVGAADGVETPISAWPLALTGSIYAGDGRTHRPTRQLVIEGKMTQDQMRLSWIFSREG